MTPADACVSPSEPLLFSCAVDDRRVPQEPIVRTAKIKGQYRFALRRAWGAGPCVGWCMLNPSTADDRRDDPTIKRVMGFSLRWGYGSLVVVNVYPFRSSSVAALQKWRSRCDRDAATTFVRNAMQAAVELSGCDQVLAAWGGNADLIDLRHFLDLCAGQFRRRTGRRFHLMCLGVTADGAPKHPLARGRQRVPDSAKPTLWRER